MIKEKKNKRGRPRKNVLNEYSETFEFLNSYYNENLKPEESEAEIKPEIEEEPKPGPEIKLEIEEEPKPGPEQKPEEEVKYFHVTPEHLIKADIIASAIIEGSLNFFGIKKDVKVMNFQEAEAIHQIMPEIKIKRSWEAFTIAYILLKIFK
jgi:hypothetical protein